MFAAGRTLPHFFPFDLRPVQGLGFGATLYRQLALIRPSYITKWQPRGYLDSACFFCCCCSSLFISVQKKIKRKKLNIPVYVLVRRSVCLYVCSLAGGRGTQGPRGGGWTEGVSIFRCGGDGPMQFIPLPPSLPPPTLHLPPPSSAGSGRLWKERAC